MYETMSYCFSKGLVNVSLDILSRIHTIPTVPIVDCFQKIRQQVKCYLQLAGVMGKNECMQVRFLFPVYLETIQPVSSFVVLVVDNVLPVCMSVC